MINSKADSYYVTLSLKDKLVLAFSSDIKPTTETPLVIDIELKDFLAVSDRE
ncbi:MAG: hypothetical protein MGG11_04830 [Trichodesmium sp. MAG_R03]|nr:hypothetical protein [Trichodesmium sp. MAG_R03]